jgi:hypothetical protein
MLYEKKVPEETFKDEDFEERAAIREFEGDLPRGQAEFFAHEEIAVRVEVQRPPVPKKQELQYLQALRNEVGKQMRVETDEKRKDELRAEWFKLCEQIIELRKEV